MALAEGQQATEGPPDKQLKLLNIVLIFTWGDGGAVTAFSYPLSLQTLRTLEARDGGRRR